MKKTLLCTSLLTAMAAVAAPAHADPIPQAVADMIRAAADENPAELAATVKVAKKANPQSAAEIDALAAQLQAEAAARHREELEGRSIFAGWDGQGEAGIGHTTGNTRSTNVALGLNFSRTGLAWDHAFAATVDYQKDQGIESKSRYFASYSGHYKFAERYYAAGIASWERDRFSGFNSRTSEGLGVGYAVLQGPEMTLSLEAGPALRQTDYITGRSENMMAGRVAADYRWNIRPNLALTQTASFYGEGHDSTVVSETGLTANLIDALSARLSFHVQYETHPPLALENTDTTTRLTLVYSF